MYHIPYEFLLLFLLFINCLTVSCELSFIGECWIFSFCFFPYDWLASGQKKISPRKHCRQNVWGSLNKYVLIIWNVIKKKTKNPIDGRTGCTWWKVLWPNIKYQFCKCILNLIFVNAHCCSIFFQIQWIHDIWQISFVFQKLN